jgi:hypothetical protein
VCENREKAPALKREIGVGLFPGALKRSFPRINAGAPTQSSSFSSSHTRSLAPEVRLLTVNSLPGCLKRRTSAAKAAPARKPFSPRLEAVPFVQAFFRNL